MEENLNVNQLIELKQMPIIFYQLEEIGKLIDEQIADVDKMSCTEDNKTEVKKRRAEINNLYNTMEDKRKEIKAKILEDYETFNEKYEEEIKSKLTYASGILKDKVDEIEAKQRFEKREKLERFANEHIKFNDLEGVIDFSSLRVNITLSASEKSLKEDIKRQIEDIANYVRLIRQEEYADEILVEYKKSLDYVEARMTVIDRHTQMQELERQRNGQQEEIVITPELKQKMEEEVIFEEIQEVTFTVWAYKDDLIKIRRFLQSLGIKYE